MRALTWHGRGDVRVESVPDPKLLNPRDAIVKVTSTAICGSDLHLYDGFIPALKPGDILGHEFMGEVVEVGSRARPSANPSRSNRLLRALSGVRRDECEARVATGRAHFSGPVPESPNTQRHSMRALTWHGRGDVCALGSVHRSMTNSSSPH